MRLIALLVFIGKTLPQHPYNSHKIFKNKKKNERNSVFDLLTNFSCVIIFNFYKTARFFALIKVIFFKKKSRDSRVNKYLKLKKKKKLRGMNLKKVFLKLNFFLHLKLAVDIKIWQDPFHLKNKLILKKNYL